MRRNFTTVSENALDVVIVGAGLSAAALLWEAASRGLRAALFAPTDFGETASIESLHLLDGSLNQTPKQLRMAMREQQTLMRIAPHLAHARPLLLPAYETSLRGCRLAVLARNLLTLDRHQHSDPQKYLPRGRILSRQEMLKAAPSIYETGLVGGALLYTSHVQRPERLALTYIRSAVERGAIAMNYAPVTELLRTGTTIAGLRVHDVQDDQTHEIRSSVVINAAGSEANAWLREAGISRRHETAMMGLNVVVNKPFSQHFALGLVEHNGSQRRLAALPWHGQTLVGTEYGLHGGAAHDFQIEDEHIQRLLDRANVAYPAAQLTLEDVSAVRGGLLPLSAADRAAVDAHQSDGLRGLLSLHENGQVSAQQLAQQALTAVHERGWLSVAGASRMAQERLHGGHFERFCVLVEHIAEQVGNRETAKRLARTYGSAYADVLARQPTDGDIWEAETCYAIREEMAQTLADVVFRRTALGIAGVPDPEILLRVAQRMARELGWSDQEMVRELDDVCAQFPQPTAMAAAIA